MSELIQFPQRLHIEFRRFVFKTVVEAAHSLGISTEHYIGRIYYAGENPAPFAGTEGLHSVYRPFAVLIDSALSNDKNSEALSDANRAYLCFRLYLHGICMERHQLPESEAELYLLDALLEYFSGKNRILSKNDELRILRYLKRSRNNAERLPT